MRKQLLAAIRRCGAISRGEAIALTAEHIVDDALKAEAIVATLPGVYVLPEHAGLPKIRRLAALKYRSRCAVSHIDGLDVWDLPTLVAGTVHLSGPEDEPPSKVDGLTVHRRRDFDTSPAFTVTRGGLRVVRIEQAIVESWALMPEIDRRVPAIVAIRERRTTGERLLATLNRQPRTAGAAQLRRVFELAAAGCHSPLEMWGHERIFTDPRLPASRCQVPLDLPTGRIYMDRYIDEILLNIELDGAAYHGEPGQRERDIKRDALVATFGIQTVRYSHPRLHGDRDGVVNELLQITAIRRRQFGLDAA